MPTTPGTRRARARRNANADLEAVLAWLGARVAAARIAAGLSQEAVAGGAGIDYKRYQRIEAGGVNVTAKTLVRIAAAIGTDFARLVGADGPANLRVADPRGARAAARAAGATGTRRLP